MSTNEVTPLLNSGDNNIHRFHSSRWTPIEILVVLYFVPVVCFIPIQQYYIVKVLADEHNVPNFIYHNYSACSNVSKSEKEIEENITEESSVFLMYLGFCSTFLSVVPILFLGSVADRFGRKSVMCFCLVGLLVKEIINIIVIHFHLSLYLLYLGQVIEGLTGGFGAMMMTLFGMTADITMPGKQRAVRISVVEGTAAMTISITLVGIGYWIRYGGFYFPALFTCALTIFASLFCIFCIPETSCFRNQNDSFCSFAYLVKCFKLYCENNQDGRRKKLIASLFVLALSGAAVLGRSSTLTLFLLNNPLCWDEVKVQVFSAVQTFFNWGSVIVVVRILHVFTQDYGILIVGSLSAMASMLLLSFANKSWLVYMYAVVGICASSVFPMIRAMMSRLCSPEEQGSLFASIGCIELLFTAISQLAYGGIYKWSVTFFPGLVFLMMAFVLFIVLIVSINLFRWMARDNDQTWKVIN